MAGRPTRALNALPTNVGRRPQKPFPSRAQQGLGNTNRLPASNAAAGDDTTAFPAVPDSGGINLRDTRLLMEYKSLRGSAPPGVYVMPSTASLLVWQGVIFVNGSERKEGEGQEKRDGMVAGSSRSAGAGGGDAEGGVESGASDKSTSDAANASLCTPASGMVTRESNAVPTQQQDQQQQRQGKGETAADNPLLTTAAAAAAGPAAAEVAAAVGAAAAAAEATGGGGGTAGTAGAAAAEGTAGSRQTGQPSTRSPLPFSSPLSPYHGAVVEFLIIFPEAYPSEPPCVRFKTPLLHPLISPTGEAAVPPHLTAKPHGVALRLLKHVHWIFTDGWKADNQDPSVFAAAEHVHGGVGAAAGPGGGVGGCKVRGGAAAVVGAGNRGGEGLAVNLCSKFGASTTAATMSENAGARGASAAAGPPAAPHAPCTADGSSESSAGGNSLAAAMAVLKPELFERQVRRAVEGSQGLAEERCARRTGFWSATAGSTAGHARGSRGVWTAGGEGGGGRGEEEKARKRVMQQVLGGERGREVWKALVEEA